MKARAEKEAELLKKRMAASDELAAQYDIDDEVEGWNPPKIPSLKSIYKDPKFLNKTGKSRFYSSYDDEGDG
jgi:hypothetical protein